MQIFCFTSNVFNIPRINCETPYIFGTHFRIHTSFNSIYQIGSKRLHLMKSYARDDIFSNNNTDCKVFRILHCWHRK